MRSGTSKSETLFTANVNEKPNNYSKNEGTLRFVGNESSVGRSGEPKEEEKLNSSSKMTCILHEFGKLYTEKLDRITSDDEEENWKVS